MTCNKISAHLFSLKWSCKTIIILIKSLCYCWTFWPLMVFFSPADHCEDAEINLLKMASSFPSPPRANARCNLHAFIALRFFCLIFHWDNVMFFDWSVAVRCEVSSCDQLYYKAWISSTWWWEDYEPRSCFRRSLTLITAWLITETLLIASVCLTSGSVTQLHSSGF